MSNKLETNCGFYTEKLLFSTLTDGKGQACTTIGGPSSNLLCVFPFEFRGKVYKTCTWEHAEPDNKAWCSTAVDNEGLHISGQGKWGHCGPSCYIPPEPRIPTTPRPPNTATKRTGKTKHTSSFTLIEIRSHSTSRFFF